jgi:hypothetical protein
MTVGKAREATANDLLFSGTSMSGNSFATQTHADAHYTTIIHTTTHYLKNCTVNVLFIFVLLRCNTAHAHGRAIEQEKHNILFKT